MLIRKAQIEDLKSVGRLTENFVTSYKVDANAFAENFPVLINNPETCLYVAEVEGVVIGYVLAFEHLTLFASGCVTWIEELTVAQAYRSQGVGAALVKAVEQHAKKRGSKQIALATRRAEKFYLTIDYEESAIYFRKIL